MQSIKVLEESKELISAFKLPRERGGRTFVPEPVRTLCLEDMHRGCTIGSSLKVMEAVLLGKSERAIATKVPCFLSWKRA